MSGSRARAREFAHNEALFPFKWDRGVTVSTSFHRAQEWLANAVTNAYNNERARMDRIRERAVLLMTAGITPVVVVAAYMAGSLRGDIAEWASILWFWSFLIAGATCLLVSVGIILYVVARGFNYKTAPQFTPVLAFADENRNEDDCLEKVHRGFLEKYSECVDQNTEINDERFGYLLISTRLIAFAFVLLLLAAPRWTYTIVQYDKGPLEVDVSSAFLPKGVRSDEQQRDEQRAETPAGSAETR